MPEPQKAVGEGASKVSSFLTRRVGPLPLWAWAGGIGVGGLVLRAMSSRGTARSAASLGGASVPGGAGGGFSSGSPIPSSAGTGDARAVLGDQTATFADQLAGQKAAFSDLISGQRSSFADQNAAFKDQLSGQRANFGDLLSAIADTASSTFANIRKKAAPTTTAAPFAPPVFNTPPANVITTPPPPPPGSIVTAPPPPPREVSPIVIAGTDSKVAAPGTPLQTISGVTIGLADAKRPIPIQDIKNAIPTQPVIPVAPVPSSGVGSTPQLLSPSNIQALNELTYNVQPPHVVAAENAVAGYDLRNYGGYFGPLNPSTGKPVNAP